MGVAATATVMAPIAAAVRANALAVTTGNADPPEAAEPRVPALPKRTVLDSPATTPAIQLALGSDTAMNACTIAGSNCFPADR